MKVYVLLILDEEYGSMSVDSIWHSKDNAHKFALDNFTKSYWCIIEKEIMDKEP